MVFVNNYRKIIGLLAEFTTLHAKEFLLLYLLIILEGLVAALSVLALVPLVDFMLNPLLLNPSEVTKVALKFLDYLGFDPTFWVFGFLFVSINFIKGILEVVTRYAILRIKYLVLRDMFGDTLISFFKARWEFFCSTEQGQLLNTFNKELVVIGDAFGQITISFAQFFQLLIYLAVPIILSPQLTLSAVGLALLFGIPFMCMNKYSYKLGKLNTESANLVMSVLSEVLGAARLILGYNRQDQAGKRFIQAFERHTSATLRSQTLSSAIPKFFQPIAILAIIISIGIALQKQVSISELAAVMWSLLGAMPILTALMQANVSIINFLPSYEQLIALRRKAINYQEVHGNRHFSTLKSCIELKNLTFTYSGRIKTLTSINLTIKKGAMTALVGESGSGKSTVVDLVLGLQVPDNGVVLVDHVPLIEWNLNTFRDRVGYVPQDSQLFNCSIRDNLVWSIDGVCESDMWESLQLANAAKFISELPMGIDTVVGDRGIRLSGGQRQRIALARALIRKPELLILDEATSALDSESERLIQQSLDQISVGTTILVIAHRLSTIKKANYVYVLEDGKVVESGVYAALIKKPNGILNSMMTA